MDLKDIKAIIDLMKKNSIAEFELERENFKIRLKRGGFTSAPISLEEGTIPVPLQVGGQNANLPVSITSTPTSGTDIEIKSPMIGTFYRAPSPEAGNYAEIGTEVTPDSVVCIIEAMKVMNEIKAEAKGIITEILIDNAKPVEFGQPLFKIRPN